MTGEWLPAHGVDGTHLLPPADLVAHELGKGCVCGPFSVPAGSGRYVFVHASLDRREDGPGDGSCVLCGVRAAVSDELCDPCDSEVEAEVAALRGDQPEAGS